MTKIKNRITFTIAVIFMIMAMLVFGGCNVIENTTYLPPEDDGYKISNYVVDVVVDENKVMTITESITAVFLDYPSNGIVRYLPLDQTVAVPNDDGDFDIKNYRNTISNVTLDKDRTTEGVEIIRSFTDSGYLFLYIGDYGNTQTECVYTFSYTLDPGDDRDTEKDLFYFNIIGTGWDTSIDNVDFSITFPSEITDEQLMFYVGRYGEDNTGSSGRVEYSISGNTISGSCNGLEYGEAVTIFKPLPQGYFSVNRSHTFDIVLIVLLLAAIAGVLALFFTKRRKTPIIDVVEFKAPDGITPSEAGFLIDQTVNGHDISALIVYWASKGFLTLNDDGKDVTIKKVKDLPNDAKEHEKFFFAALFQNRTEVKSSELSKISPSVGGRCKKSIERKKIVYFNSAPTTWFRVLAAVYFILAIVLAVRIGNESFNTFSTVFWRLILSVISLVALLFLPGIVQKKDGISRKAYIFKLVVNFIFIFATAIGSIFIGEMYCDPFYLSVFILLLLLLLFFTYPSLEMLTPKGRELLGRVRGLKTYIEVAEKDKMEAMVKDNPTLFYDVLPFAYVLGVSNVYMNKFKDVALPAPEWLTTSAQITTLIALNSISRSMFVLGTVMSRGMVSTMVKVARVAAVAAAIGSSAGGGGFSGGGVGGGGGGRF